MRCVSAWRHSSSSTCICHPTQVALLSHLPQNLERSDSPLLGYSQPALCLLFTFLGAMHCFCYQQTHAKACARGISSWHDACKSRSGLVTSASFQFDSAASKEATVMSFLVAPVSGKTASLLKARQTRMLVSPALTSRPAPALLLHSRSHQTVRLRRTNVTLRHGREALSERAVPVLRRSDASRHFLAAYAGHMFF